MTTITAIRPTRYLRTHGTDPVYVPYGFEVETDKGTVYALFAYNMNNAAGRRRVDIRTVSPTGPIIDSVSYPAFDEQSTCERAAIELADALDWTIAPFWQVAS